MKTGKKNRRKLHFREKKKRVTMMRLGGREGAAKGEKPLFEAMTKRGGKR